MAYLGHLTHTYHEQLEIPSGIDMIIHSGDCSNNINPYLNENEVRQFIEWYKKVPVKHKIYVAGNHDTSIEKDLLLKKILKKQESYIWKMML